MQLDHTDMHRMLNFSENYLDVIKYDDGKLCHSKFCLVKQMDRL